MSAFSTLSLLIDNDEKLLDYVIYMAIECVPGLQCLSPLVINPGEKSQLADYISAWFTNAVEEFDISLSNLYDKTMISLLRQLVYDIPEQDWQLLAEHYIRKAIDIHPNGAVQTFVQDPFL